MKYNILKDVSLFPNYDYGTVILSLDTVNNLVDNNASLSVDKNEVFCVESDLGQRVYLDRLNYYYTGNINVSDIILEVKEDISSEYTSLTMISGTGSIYFDGYKPRYIRLTHSNTLDDVIINGIEVINIDSYIKFGSLDGNDEIDIRTSINEAAFYKDIPIYNTTSNIVDAYININNDTADILTDLLYISTDGVEWVNLSTTDNILFDEDHITGSPYNLKVIDNTIILDDTTQIGIFTTGIFYNKGVFNKLYIDNYLPDNTSMSYSDNIATVKMAFSDIKPKNRILIRMLTYNSYQYGDYDFYDNTLLYSDQIVASNARLYSNYKCLIDKQNDIMYGIYKSFTSDSIILFINDKINNIKKENNLSNYVSQPEFIFMEKDKDDGIWIYFYMISDNINNTLTTGYHLMHFDNTLEESFHVSYEYSFLDGMSACPTEPTLWYTSSYSSLVSKIDYKGSIILEIDSYINDLKSIITMSDGGCLFLNSHDLHFIDKYGDLFESKFNIFEADKLYKSYDDEDIIFYTYNNYLHKYIISAGKTSKIYYIPSAYDYFFSNSGIFAYCTDDKLRLINYESDIIGEFNVPYGNVPCILDLDYNDTQLLNYFPVNSDTVWNNIEYKEINFKKYILPSEKYIQFKINFVPYVEFDEDGDVISSLSPELYKVYVSQGIVLKNITPGNYKNLKIKIESANNVYGYFEPEIDVSFKVYE